MATAIESHQQDFYSNVRASARKVWEGTQELLASQAEFNAGEYGTLLAAGTGANDGLVRGDIGPAVFDAANAIKAVFDGGVATTLVKLL